MIALTTETMTAILLLTGGDWNPNAFFNRRDRFYMSILTSSRGGVSIGTPARAYLNRVYGMQT